MNDLEPLADLLGYQRTVFLQLLVSWLREHDSIDRDRILTLASEAQAVKP